MNIYRGELNERKLQTYKNDS